MTIFFFFISVCLSVNVFLCIYIKNIRLSITSLMYCSLYLFTSISLQAYLVFYTGIIIIILWCLLHKEGWQLRFSKQFYLQLTGNPCPVFNIIIPLPPWYFPISFAIYHSLYDKIRKQNFYQLYSLNFYFD